MARPTGRYTKELLATARAAGCVWLSFGVETGSERLLDLCRKGTHVAEIRAAITPGGVVRGVWYPSFSEVLLERRRAGPGIAVDRRWG